MSAYSESTVAAAAAASTAAEPAWRPRPGRLLGDVIAMITDRRVHPAVVSNEDLQGLLTRLNRLDEGLVESEPELDDHRPEQVDFRDASAEDEVPAVELVHSVIAQAIDQGASDIH